MRSEVCNRFACDGLRELQLRLDADVAPGDPAPEWLFVQGPHAEPTSTRLHPPLGNATE